MGEDPNWELGRKTEYFNGTMRKLRLERGLLQKDVAKAVGVATIRISQIETMRSKPSKELAEKIAYFFGVKVEDIFPEFLDILTKKVPKTEIKYARLSAQALEEYTQKQYFIQADNTNPEDSYRRNDIYDKLDKAVESLTDREKKIIKMRFGLHGEKPHTLEEIGIEFDVNRERIRQIEMKAIEKLRRSKAIAEIKSWDNLNL